MSNFQVSCVMWADSGWCILTFPSTGQRLRISQFVMQQTKILSNLKPDFSVFLQNSSLLDKKAMLVALQNSILSEESNVRKNSVPNSELENLVDLVPDFISPDDEDLTSGITKDLHSLEALKPSKEVTSQWLSLIDLPYSFGKATYEAKDLNNYPHIHRLLDLVNAHGSTTGDATACLVNYYSDSDVSGRLHADDEPIISQTSSITTVTFGPTREIIFKRGKNKPTLKSLILKDKSAFIMHPGCQKHLQHQLLPGSPGTGGRYSISFRKAVSPLESKPPTLKLASASILKLPSGSLLLPLASPELSTEHNGSSSFSFSSEDIKQSRTIPTADRAALIIGDSISAKLNATKIGKGRVKVFNKAVGGATISKTETQLDEFYSSEESLSVYITNVFISVGTNDIRYAYERGVKYLKAPLRRLINKVKLCFPTAIVHIHSLLPIAPVNRYTVRNVLQMNDIIYSLCKQEEIFHFDFFKNFVDEWGERRDDLFWDCVHPTPRAMGILARRYIRVLHKSSFNPHAY